jgi:hypothetical protein
MLSTAPKACSKVAIHVEQLSELNTTAATTTAQQATTPKQRELFGRGGALVLPNVGEQRAASATRLAHLEAPVLANDLGNK